LVLSARGRRTALGASPAWAITRPTITPVPSRAIAAITSITLDPPHPATLSIPAQLGGGELQIVIAALFVSAAGLNALANWLQIPYPIPLVLGGLVLGLLPGMPEVELDPDMVLLLFLPPLLYAAAFFSDLRALRADARAISLNAIGLVLVTIGVVAAIDHEAIGMPWALSFVLGAIVSPTDPLRRRRSAAVGAPRRLVNIVEGESLVNDATALVAYKVAVAAAVGETVSAGDAVLEFVGAAVGGIAIGLAVGWVIAEVRRRVNDVNTELTISLFSAYGAFIPAEELGASGVLAVVAAGIYLGFRAPEIASPESRMQGFALWSILTFLLNAVLFILIGLQLPVIVDGLTASRRERSSAMPRPSARR
jgi:CPA1 family monovalent cation:H+ antiporter